MDKHKFHLHTGNPATEKIQSLLDKHINNLREEILSMDPEELAAFLKQCTKWREDSKT